MCINEINAGCKSSSKVPSDDLELELQSTVSVGKLRNIFLLNTKTFPAREKPKSGEKESFGELVEHSSVYIA